MSDKRFVCGLGFPINSDDPIRIISDGVENKDYYKFSDICKVLNEQQDTIFKLQDLCGQSDGENAKLRIENKRLQELNDDKGKRIISLIRTNKTLKEESEQLRKELKELENNYKDLLYDGGFDE